MVIESPHLPQPSTEPWVPGLTVELQEESSPVWVPSRLGLPPLSLTNALAKAVPQLTFEHRIGTAGLESQRRKQRVQMSSKEQEAKYRCTTKSRQRFFFFFKEHTKMPQ